ncbi:uncharacterized protein HMPREF1541_02976 [Cyphellophora europaea CBS 101466]|uniref:Amidohydrolase 3 domain-containing protein n=1 Tax=Cyphellophora europaea (strain CBS 101466) TaxID=1220924 RepID=W2RX72_CYPE1|nr:uncharacterized protein HMPREF1541_02976 [Cyphellophora europaea CBS 101466]ETN41042.1 hypothetical protein HMPREF1541_02976 [Cyphellophora europaea CBS 101466]
MSIIFRNARIVTATQELIDDSVLVVQKGIISYLGPYNDQVKKLEADAEIHDLQGRILGPGFVDGHMHLLLHGASIRKIGLEHCKTLEDIRAALKAGAAERPNVPRLFGRGYMQHMTPGEPTAAMLDGIDSRPIYINSKDLHSTWCNTAAMDELNVGDTPDPKGGTIHRDADGQPTGLMSEAAAINIVWPHMNKITPYEEKLDQVHAAIKSYSSTGYTGLVELATDDEIWSLMMKLHEEKAPIRMAAHWLVAPSENLDDSLAQVDRAVELHKQYNLTSSPDCRIAGIKLILDGIVDACTAALSKPYTSNAAHPDTFWTAEHLRAVVRKADEAGLQCALHAIGDRAVTLAVDTLEACGSPGRRHRIEHLELTSPGDAARLGKLGITASIQPVHADPCVLRAWPTILGTERCGRAFAYKEFHDGGATIAIGTDAPTAPTHPLQNMYVATTRKSAREPEAGDLNAVNQNFALPLAVAMAGAAEGAAKSCFAEKRVGTLEVGKCADFVVLGMEWNHERLLEAQVRETWFGGRRVYKKS